MCQMDTALCPTENISWYFYTLFIHNAKHIKTDCDYEVKLQMYNITYNLQKHL